METTVMGYIGILRCIRETGHASGSICFTLQDTCPNPTGTPVVMASQHLTFSLFCLGPLAGRMWLSCEVRVVAAVAAWADRQSVHVQCHAACSAS